MLITDLEPQSLWYYFNEICKIPRPSKHEGRMADYLIDFAEKQNLQYRVDHLKNVLISKPGTRGYENKEIVVLQSHQDMVGEKNQDKVHDFTSDPIEPIVDGDWVRANNTTLGADDGIGIAAQLAVLASTDIPHPPLECLFTVDEETGLTGAFGLAPDFLKGRLLINLDSEDWGEVFIGCAGGRDTHAVFTFTPSPVPPAMKAYNVSVTGLNGGHSGDEIHKGLGNSIKIVNRLVEEAKSKFQLELSSIKGGNARNAIPREAVVSVYISEKQQSDFENFVKEYENTARNELCVTAPDLKISAIADKGPDFIMDADTQDRLIKAISVCPHGEQAWSQTLEGLVETSTNLATISTGENTVAVGTSQRSSVGSKLDAIVRVVQNCFLLAGAQVESSAGYPGWEPNPDSAILEITVEAHEKLFNKEPVVRAIHAGLECGLIGEKYAGIDMVSIGPTIKGAHTPEEKIHIGTTLEFWQLLIEILKNI